MFRQYNMIKLVFSKFIFGYDNNEGIYRDFRNLSYHTTCGFYFCYYRKISNCMMGNA
jgi:hypothetical protein